MNLAPLWGLDGGQEGPAMSEFIQVRSQEFVWFVKIN